MSEPQPVTAPDDATALAARAQRGDVAAFEQLYAQCAGRVFAVCLRMSGDRQRARELTHDAFVRAWERLASFRGESGFETWMHRLTVNVVLASVRSDRRRESRVALTGDLPSPTISAPGRAVGPGDVAARIDLESAVAALTPQARMVFVLHDVEGYRHEEIAQRLALAPGTIRAQLHRARQQLMRMLTR